MIMSPRLAAKVYNSSPVTIVPWRVVGTRRALTDDEANGQYLMLNNRGDIPPLSKSSAKEIYHVGGNDGVEVSILEFPIAKEEIALLRLRPEVNEGDNPIKVGI